MRNEIYKMNIEINNLFNFMILRILNNIKFNIVLTFD